MVPSSSGLVCWKRSIGLHDTGCVNRLNGYEVPRSARWVVYLVIQLRRTNNAFALETAQSIRNQM